MDLDELSLWPAKLGMLSLSSRSASPGMLSSTESTATSVSGDFCSSMQPFGFLNFIGNDLRNCILWLSWFGGTYLHLLCFLFLPFEFLNFIWNDHKLETVSATSDFLGLGEPGYWFCSSTAINRVCLRWFLFLNGYLCLRCFLFLNADLVSFCSWLTSLCVSCVHAETSTTVSLQVNLRDAAVSEGDLAKTLKTWFLYNKLL